MAEIKITYSTTVAKGLKNKIRQDIIDSFEGSPELRKEMKRVFQMANRRIQNIEKSGVFSPAVASLGKGDVKGYSKFTVKGFGNTGSDWKSLKKEYAKAISFLNQPTSTASGAKQFEKQVKKQMGVPDDLWKEIRRTIIDGYNSVSSELLLALPYSDFMQEVYNRAKDSSAEQIEQEAKAIADNLQAQIDQTAETASQTITEIIENMAKGFKIDF